MRPVGVAAFAAFMLASTSASAAVLIDTGVGSFLPNGPLGAIIGQQQVGFVVGPQLRTHAQFTLPQLTGISHYKINGLQFYGTVQTAGTMNFSLAVNDASGNQPGIFIANQLRFVEAQGPAWIGVGGEIANLLPGTYWIGFGSDGGTLVARHFGNAPNSLGQESYYLPAPFPLNSYVDNDNANLSWRILGEAVPVQAAVPEPASWALMILGFAAAGAAIRNSRLRRSQTTA
jgi:hypothetical protein